MPVARLAIPPSYMSTLVAARRASFQDGAPAEKIAEASAFAVTRRQASYLVTNWHVVTHRNPLTNTHDSGYSVLPDRLQVIYPIILGGDLYWGEAEIPLYETDGRARWLVHPDHWDDSRIDVVAIPLGDLGKQFSPYLLEGERRGSLGPTSEVYVVGYPFGVNASAAVWVRGTVASEPQLGFEDERAFLVNARTWSGQSGSPVIEYWGAPTPPPVPRSGPDEWRLRGVYSSRPIAGLDLGKVWPVEVIEEIIDCARRDSMMFE